MKQFSPLSTCSSQVAAACVSKLERGSVEVFGLYTGTRLGPLASGRWGDADAQDWFRGVLPQNLVQLYTWQDSLPCVICTAAPPPPPGSNRLRCPFLFGDFLVVSRLLTSMEDGSAGTSAAKRRRETPALVVATRGAERQGCSDHSPASQL